MRKQRHLRKINAPIIPTVVLKEDAILIPASRISSKEVSINKISKITGKGIASLELPIANRSSEGRSSWWKLVMATYKPGKNIAKNKAKSLINLKKLAKV